MGHSGSGSSLADEASTISIFDPAFRNLGWPMLAFFWLTWDCNALYLCDGVSLRFGFVLALGFEAKKLPTVYRSGMATLVPLEIARECACPTST